MSKNTQTSGLTNYITYSGSNVAVSGSLTVTGSLNVTGGITGSFQGVATTASYVLNAVSASFATTASYAISASIATSAVTASYVLNAVSASFATTAVTSSFANAFTVAGTLTATTLVVQTITSSVLYSSGSNVFGNSLSNTQNLTGSVGITGSLAINGITNIGTRSSGNIRNLNIYGATNANAIIKIDGADGNGYGAQIDFVSKQTGGTSNTWTLGTGINGGTNAFELYNGSTTPLSINLSGSVGIGTTSPNDILTISRNAADNAGGLTLYNANTSGYGSAVTFRVNYAGVYNTSRIHGDWDTGNAGALHFYTANTSQTLVERMTITGGGNVGIGTTSPRGLLQLYGAEVAAFKTYTGQGNTGGGDTIINAYRLDGSSAYLRVTDIVALGDDTNNRGSSIRLMTTNTSGVTSAAMIITPSGSVGIGTANPAGKVHIAATTGVTTPGSIALAIRDSGNSGYGFDFNLEGVATGDMSLMRTEAGSQSQVMTFKRSNGNVGIGTTSPSAISTYTTLDVRGATGAAIRMGLTGSATPFNLQHDGTDAYLNNVANGSMYFYTNDALALQINRSGGNSTMTLGTTGEVPTIKAGGTNTDLKLEAIGSGGHLYFYTNVTLRMIVKSDGNVGIGNTFNITPYFVSGQTSGVLQTATNISKSSTASVDPYPLAFFGSNDSSNPLGLLIQMYTGATTSAKKLKIQGTAIGISANDIVINNDGGNVLIGTTANASNYQFVVNTTAYAKQLIAFGVSDDGRYLGQGNQISGAFQSYDLTLVNYATSGRITITNSTTGVYLANGATSWSTFSDERLKNINGTINNALNKLLSIRAVDYSWKSDNTNKGNLGLIAQDVEKVFPQVIDKSKSFSETDNTEYLSVKYTELIPVLVKAIQELSAKNDALQTRITQLENK